MLTVIVPLIVQSSAYVARHQCAEKVLSNSLGLVDFPVMLVLYLDSVCYLPHGQMKALGKSFQEIQITEVL